MSQAKVDKYKEQKAHRKEIFAKEKRKEKLEKGILIGIVVLVIGAIAGGIGLTAINSYKAQLAARPNYDREELVISDLSSLVPGAE